MKQNPRKRPAEGYSVPPPGFAPPARPLVDRVVLTISLTTILGRILAEFLRRVLSFLECPRPDARPVGHGRCRRSPVVPGAGFEVDEDDEADLQALGLLGSEEEDRCGNAPSRPQRRDPVGSGRIPRRCPSCNEKVSLWCLRYSLPALPGFREHATPCIGILARWYENTVVIVNHYMQVDVNPTRLLQTHALKVIPDLPLWYPRPASRQSNFVLLGNGQEGDRHVLDAMFALQLDLLLGVVTAARRLYGSLIDDAWSFARVGRLIPDEYRELEGPPEPTVRIKRIEVYQDRVTASPATDVEQMRCHIGYALKHLSSYDDGEDGCYGELRRGRTEKFYRKIELQSGKHLMRQESVFFAKALQSMFRMPPEISPERLDDARAMMEEVVEAAQSLWYEVASNSSVAHWRISDEDLMVLLDGLQIRLKNRKTAMKVIRGHAAGPVDRSTELLDVVGGDMRRTHKAEQRAVRRRRWVLDDFLPKLEVLRIYRRSCRRGGPGRMVPAVLRSTIRKMRRGWRSQ